MDKSIVKGDKPDDRIVLDEVFDIPGAKEVFLELDKQMKKKTGLYEQMEKATASDYYDLTIEDLQKLVKSTKYKDMKEETMFWCDTHDLTTWVTGGFVDETSKKKLWPATWHARLKEGNRILIKADGDFRRFDMFLVRFFGFEKVIRFKFAKASFFLFLKTPLV